MKYFTSFIAHSSFLSISSSFHLPHPVFSLHIQPTSTFGSINTLFHLMAPLLLLISPFGLGISSFSALFTPNILAFPIISSLAVLCILSHVSAYIFQGFSAALKSLQDTLEQSCSKESIVPAPQHIPPRSSWACFLPQYFNVPSLWNACRLMPFLNICKHSIVLFSASSCPLHTSVVPCSGLHLLESQHLPLLHDHFPSACT